MPEKTKRELLEQLEQNVMILVRDITLTKIGLEPVDFKQFDDPLRKIIDAIVELKRLEGLPSHFKKVVEGSGGE